ncbi:MAG TPA: amidohydrolase family protein [Acetobacteraceae bacterium]|jgi:predicted TIM-barrel fold metal-dependent hydrolase
MMQQTHSRPETVIPDGAGDCHMHVFGPLSAYPPSPRRAYTPRIATLEDWAAMAGRIGLQRQVLVQPSAYGTDNRCMLDAMREAGDRCRGVAVIDDATTDEELHRMQGQGVRGVRINAASIGVDDPTLIAPEIARTMARVAPLGWHIQLFAKLAVIDALADFLATSAVPVVIDHMGLARAELGVDQPGFAALLALLRSGPCWVKLSGVYRMSSAAPGHEDAAPIAKALMAANPGRAIWGTDWPHTGEHGHATNGDIPLVEYRKLDDGRLLDMLAGWCGDAAMLRRVLVENPAELYGFPPLP